MSFAFIWSNSRWLNGAGKLSLVITFCIRPLYPYKFFGEESLEKDFPENSGGSAMKRAAIALEGPDGDSAAVIEAILRPVASEVIR